jgi:transcriptional regulator with PAS, ATPase and Fis domain
VLIEGESGTGKELVARAIHNQSARRQGPFVALNCAGLSEELAASQLFGHRRGSFTGAYDDQAGLFEAASGGTLFLDEIGELPIRVQTSLLRVLEENAVLRLGESNLRPVDVRIIAATHRDLAREVEEKRFRHDLFYRIRVARVKLPPLRERRDDLPLLARAFLAQHRAATGKEVEGDQQRRDGHSHDPPVARKRPRASQRLGVRRHLRAGLGPPARGPAAGSCWNSAPRGPRPIRYGMSGIAS